MRFLLFDRVLDHVPGRHVHGIKTITRTESAFEGHFPLRSIYPGTLVIESMVQILGWLAMRTYDYGILVVMSGLEDATVPSDLEPGTTLELHGELTGTNKRGSVGRTWAEREGERVASIGRVIYGHVPHPDPVSLRTRFQTQGGLP